MAIHYLGSGRNVRTNHLPNPDFEIDTYGWVPINANTTIEVVTGHQYHGGKALKITGNGLASNDRYGVTTDRNFNVGAIRAPLSVGYVHLVASISADAANPAGSCIAHYGVFKEDAAGTILTSQSKWQGGQTSTPKRMASEISQYMPAGLANTDYIRPQITFEFNAAGVFYIDAVMLTPDWWEGYGTPGWPSFITGNRTNGEDGLNYAWTGEPHRSASTGTATRWVDIPEVGEIGEPFTITGGAFFPSEPVRVMLIPEVADTMTLETTSNADGTFSYTFDMPAHTGGTTRIQVGASGAWLGQPYAEGSVIIPVPPPLIAPATTATQKVNYFLDPRLELTDGKTVLAKNHFHNPSPTDSLHGFNAAGLATIALDPASSIKGAGGVRVDSTNAVSGIAIKPQELLDEERPSFTVYVRAREAMTITASVYAGGHSMYEFNMTNGWGDFGWGEPYSYVEGWSHTFAAGEVKRFRVNPSVIGTVSGGTHVQGTPIDWALQLFGDGTFDVDGVWFGWGVNDGVDPEGFPGGVGGIANAPLFFSGDTPDDDNYTYEWEGIPQHSISVKKGNRPKYLRSWGNGMHPDMEMTFLLKQPDGSTIAAVQSDWDESEAGAHYFTADGPADGVGEDLKYLGLVEGKHYAITFTLTSAMENYIEGYIGGLWDQMWVEANGIAYLGIPMDHPLQRTVTLPLTVDAGVADAQFSLYRNWYTGYHFVDNVSLVEIDLHVQFDQPYNQNAGTQDLIAAGAVPGGTYTAVADQVLEAAGQFYRTEIQAVEGGAWTTLEEVPYDPDYKSETYEWTFTIPADAVGARLAWQTQTWAPTYLFFYSVPIPYFDGDTPDGGGFYYSWSGTPGESASIRSTTPPGPPPEIDARVFVGGASKQVAEMRVVSGGVLRPVSEIGAI